MKKILFTLIIVASFAATVQANSRIAFLRYTKGYWQVWVMNKDGGAQKQLTFSQADKRDVSWFKDGKKLLVSTNLNDIYVTNLSTGKEKLVQVKLPVSKAYIRDIMLSPDDKQFVFVIDKQMDSNGEVWVSDLDGQHVRRIYKSQYFLSKPVWTYNGNDIVFRVVPFLHGNELGHNIWIMKNNGTEAKLVMNDRPSHSDQVCSKLNQISFSSLRDSNNYNIWVVGLNGKGLKEVTSNMGDTSDPSWSPNGRHIAFTSNKTGRDQIWVIRSDGTGLTQLTHGPQGAHHPVWSYEY